MKCVTPLIRAYKKGYPDDYYIISKKKVAMSLDTHNNYIRLLTKDDPLNEWKFQEIPCGNCYACRLTYSAEWATRLMLEKTYYPDHECWFITLTYDEDHINIPNEMRYQRKFNPKQPNFDYSEKIYKNDGTWNGTLKTNDLRNFIQSLRRLYPTKEIRYFACGEYGVLTLRPHYHLIVFGCPFNELYDSYIDPKWHKDTWKCRELNRIWKNGLHQITPVEWSNAAYTARYCMKKVGDTWNKEEWAKLGKIPEFVRMSRDIGMRYYEDHKEEIWKNDCIIMKTVKGNIGNTKPPRAFLRKLEQEDPLRAQKIKDRRQFLAEHSTDRQRMDSDYNDLEELIIRASQIETKAKMLKREM